MKIGLIGAGAVGRASLFALVAGNVADEIVVLDKNKAAATGVVHDLRYGAVLGPPLRLRAGDYADLADAAIVVITAGINEKAGGATDRADPQGRLRLLATNAGIYEEIVPQVVAVAPEAVIVVVTDPPDPLAGLTRSLAGHPRVVSTGTLLDSLRFRCHVAERLKVSPNAVQATVVGEHGTSAVFLWSGVRVSGVPLKAVAGEVSDTAEWHNSVENDVRFANISIIEGTGASQLGIGMVVARICRAIAHDERTVLPIGSHIERLGVTLSLPSVVGRHGVEDTFVPEMTAAEAEAFENSVGVLRKAEEQLSA